MDKESFTKDELKNNKESAHAADYAADYAAAAAAAGAGAYDDAAAAAAAAAGAGAYDDVDVDYWIGTYFKKTGENKQDYIDEIKRAKELVKERALEYTQEMADNGELPSIGMECMVLNTNCAHPKYIKGLIKYVSDLVIYAYVENGERCDNVKTLKFKPLTPPITLENGKAYQFDVNGDFMIGIYQESQDHFDSATHITPSSRCTNIELLTVEDKLNENA